MENPIFAQVKFLAVILSIVILAFSTTACADEPDVHAAGHVAHEITDAGSHHTHTDFCSPLCACGCCAAPVIVAVGYFIPTLTAHSAHLFSEMPAGQTADVSLAVWQPPQA